MWRLPCLWLYGVFVRKDGQHHRFSKNRSFEDRRNSSEKGNGNGRIWGSSLHQDQRNTRQLHRNVHKKPFRINLVILVRFLHQFVQQVWKNQPPWRRTLNLFLHQWWSHVASCLQLPYLAHHRPSSKQIPKLKYGRKNDQSLHQHSLKFIPLNQHPLHCHQPYSSESSSYSRLRLLIEIIVL